MSEAVVCAGLVCVVGLYSAQAQAQAAPAGAARMAWSYVGYGAGNYGTTSHSNPRRQHRRLLQSVANLVKQYGSKGVVYVNDLPGLAKPAISALRRLKRQKHWAGLQIKSLPGDFSKIRLPKTTFAELANPEWDGLKGSVLRRLLASTKVMKVTTYFAQDLRDNLKRLGQGISHVESGEGKPYLDTNGKAYDAETRDFYLSDRKLDLKKLLW